MDLMKVFDQAVREIKREVNLKVLKVPEIEQKVLDATNDEPWGPHGSALSELAQATKKFTECQLVMNVLWTRLIDTGPNWRHVYKALAVIEYLLANGSERAVDDILEHSFQISAISGFEYVEPNGKDVGINVRKKVETILALLNDRDKIKTIREKAASNRDKYVGLSSTGMSYRSSSASYGSGNFSSNFQNSDRYGSLSGPREGDSFRDSYKDGEQYGKESKSKHDNKDDENKGSKVKKQVGNKPSSIPPSKTPNVQANIEDNDFDFDPRGSSSAGSSLGKTKQVDLFGQSLMDDLIDTAPTTLPERTADYSNNTPEVDLFADATFQSASPAEAIPDSHAKGNIDLFSSQPAIPSAFPSSVDFFAVPDAGLPSETKSTKMVDAESFDPFAAIPLNNFGGSDDPFGTFASHAKTTNIEPSQNSTAVSVNNLDEDTIFGDFTSHTEQKVPESSKHSSTINLDSLTESSPATKKDNFQVKSGIWADCLNRGLIDLTISAPKKVNLADIGIVGGLEDASAEKEKGPPTAAFMGRSMGAGSSGMAWPGLSSSTGGSGSFANFGEKQFGHFK